MQAAEHLSFSSYAWRLGLVILLVLANAFFVAAEFALVGARRSKIDQLAAGGDRLAKAAQSAIKELDRYISATQLGITLASLGLGWIGQSGLGLDDEWQPAELSQQTRRYEERPVCWLPSGICHSHRAAA